MQSPILRLFIMTLFLGFSANAYDIDTHFYATSAVLIKSGIKKEVALKLAAYSEWMEESAMTRLIAMTKPPLKKMGHLNGPILQRGQGVLDEVKESNPMAYDILKKGFEKGDFILIGAGLRLVINSFSNSESLPPDFDLSNGDIEQALLSRNISKYYRMLKTVFRITTLLRHALPNEAKDPNLMLLLKSGQQKRAIDATADEIYLSFVSQADVQRAVEKNIQRSQEFTRFSVALAFASLSNNGIISDQAPIAAIVQNQDLYTEENTSEEILTLIFKKLLTTELRSGEPLINIPALQRMFLGYSSPQFTNAKFISDHEGIEPAAKHLAQLVSTRLLKPGGAGKRGQTLEFNGAPYNLEKSLRLSNWQIVLQNLIQEKVLFSRNLTLREFIVQTFNSRYQDRHSAKTLSDFKGLNPGSGASPDIEVTEISARLHFQENIAWNWRMFSILYRDYLRFQGLRWKSDRVHESREVIDPKDYLLRNEESFKKALEDGLFKQIITAPRVQKLELQYQKMHSAWTLERKRLCIQSLQ